MPDPKAASTYSMSRPLGANTTVGKEPERGIELVPKLTAV